MGAYSLKKLCRSLKILALATFVVVFSVIFWSAASLARSVTDPLPSLVCCQTPAGFNADYITIQFSTADGLALSAWYIPPRNGAVIILVHSYFSDRRQTLPVAQMLYKHGYGLLMYDQRASGESAGALRSLGALDIPDLRQAARWLAGREKNLAIGAYGCSMGGAISLAGAVDTASILAVAADAPSPLGWDENLPAFNRRDPLSLPVIALYYRLVQLRTHALPPASTLEITREYGSRPLLLISSGSGAEFLRVGGYLQAASGPKSHWNIPEAGHCGGAAARPLEYEQKLVDFFDSLLLKNK